MADDRAYKKFLLQKSVLDSLRVYLELNDTFYAHLEEAALMPKEELDKIKEMQWPLSRNLLLQTLVRLPWDKHSFDRFCGVIEGTQQEQLNKLVVVKAKALLKSIQEPEVSNEPLPGESIENGREQLSTQMKNAIKIQLRDKEERIRTLETENHDLKSKITMIQADNRDINNQSASLDKCVSDMLTAIAFDLEEAPIESLLVKVSEIYWKNVAEIKRMTNDIKALKTANRELRDRVTMFTEEDIALKAQIIENEKKYEDLKSSSNISIETLRDDLLKEKQTTANLQNNLRNTGVISTKQLEGLRQELEEHKAEVAKMKKEMSMANKERDAAKEELREVNDRTRKLLISLDLLNSCDSMGKSVDHARNIGYSRRRRGPNAPPLPPPSSETVQLAGELSEMVLGGVPPPSARGVTGGGALPSITIMSPRPGSVPEYTTRPLSGHSSSVSVSSNSSASKKDENSSLSGNGTPFGTRSNNIKCKICDKVYNEASNYEGACLYHPYEATKLNEGTEMEIWSCCKSIDTIKGCQKTKHIAVA